MLTAIVAATAFIIGSFFERIVFAVMVLVLARWALRAARRARARINNIFAPHMAKIKATASRRWNMVRFAFGPTIRVAV